MVRTLRLLVCIYAYINVLTTFREENDLIDDGVKASKCAKEAFKSCDGKKLIFSLHSKY